MMGASPLFLANALYTECEERSIHYYRTGHHLFREFHRHSRALQRQAGEYLDDPSWAAMIRSLNRYRFIMSAAPLPFDDPSAEPRFTEAVMQSLVARLAPVYPGTAALARETVELFLLLRKCTDNPFLDSIEALFGQEAGSVAILVRDSRLLEPSVAALNRRDGLSHFDVVGLEGVRGATTYTRLIITGPASWYPDYVFQAPRSRLLEVVAYQWNRVRWRPEQTFIEPYCGAAKVGELITEAEVEAETDEQWPEIDWSEIARFGVERVSGDADGGDEDGIAAYLFVLHGGKAVFLDGSDGARCLVIDPRDYAEARVKRIEVRNLEPGMFVLLRTEGGGDYIIPVADKLLGESAEECRIAQQYWKLLLRNHVLRDGLFETCIQLLELGSTRANESNVRNWMSERTIGTEREDDFLAIMRLIGLDNEYDRYRKITRRIKAAHLRAGTVIRRRLIEQVMAVDVGDLEKRGTLVFELPDTEGGQLTAFRVESRAPSTVDVPGSRLDRVFDRVD